jgi:hypothetical protein
MTAEPNTDYPSDRDPESPRWLGSVARRGLAQEHGAGWKEEELDGEGAQPKWLGSVARREGNRSDDPGWVDPEEAERPKWLGSVARRGDSARSLVLIDMGAEPSEETPEKTAETPQEAENPSTTGDSSPGLKETLALPKPADELDERQQPQSIFGDLGLHLRIAS